MAIDGLVSRFEEVRSRITERTRLSERVIARQALIEEFGVEPTAMEITELVLAVELHHERERSEDEFWADDELDERERQTRGGREVIYKSEHRAG